MWYLLLLKWQKYRKESIVVFLVGCDRTVMARYDYIIFDLSRERIPITLTVDSYVRCSLVLVIIHPRNGKRYFEGSELNGTGAIQVDRQGQVLDEMWYRRSRREWKAVPVETIDFLL